MQSESIKELATALSKAQVTITNPKRTTDGQSGNQKHKYATLSDVWDAIRKPLTSNGLAVIQTTKPTDENKVCVVTTLVHNSGEWIQGELTLPFDRKGGPQGAGSAITYARRYALAAIVGVYQEDDDAKLGQGTIDNQNNNNQQTNQTQAEEVAQKTELVRQIKAQCEQLGWDAKAYADHNGLTPISPVDVLKNHADTLVGILNGLKTNTLSEAEQAAMEEYAS